MANIKKAVKNLTRIENNFKEIEYWTKVYVKYGNLLNDTRFGYLKVSLKIPVFSTLSNIIKALNDRMYAGNIIAFNNEFTKDNSAIFFCGRAPTKNNFKKFEIFDLSKNSFFKEVFLNQEKDEKSFIEKALNDISNQDTDILGRTSYRSFVYQTPERELLIDRKNEKAFILYKNGGFGDSWESDSIEAAIEEELLNILTKKRVKDFMQKNSVFLAGNEKEYFSSYNFFYDNMFFLIDKNKLNADLLTDLEELFYEETVKAMKNFIVKMNEKIKGKEPISRVNAFVWIGKNSHTEYSYSVREFCPEKEETDLLVSCGFNLSYDLTSRKSLLPEEVTVSKPEILINKTGKDKEAVVKQVKKLFDFAADTYKKHTKEENYELLYPKAEDYEFESSKFETELINRLNLLKDLF